MTNKAQNSDTEIIMPKNANDFKYHKFKRENQYTDLQVDSFKIRYFI